MSTATFTVVDDCRTDVSSIDSEFVYLPFETLQRLNNMAGEFSADAPSRIVRPPRCSQIHIKVKDDFSRGRKLHETAGKIRRVWAEFHVRNPQASAGKVSVETWRQRQVKVIGPIEKQRTLTVIMFGIISVVSVVLIFAIFYMIVVQKTRDIGVLKAVGASSGGVAWIFLTYGAAVGLIGAVLGTVGGYYFVRYINPIQDAIDKWFGFRVWSKEVFMFEKIPNQVDLTTAGLIVIGAVVAGVVGALIPAVRAARMQPVEALRYE
jgi:lipoprotein-releasing system permease protein